MDRRRPVLLAAAALALVAGAVTGVPATAAPPTASADYQAPYGGYARFGSSTTCTAGATCDVTGSAVPATGTFTSTSSFARSVPASGREYAFGYAFQGIVFKVPPSASSVTATFTWRIDESSVRASSTSGLLQAYTGVVAYAANCGGDCTSEVESAPVHYAGSAVGVPSSGLQPAATEATLTVTASGKLPRHLMLYGYPYSVAAGDRSKICASETECETLQEAHAGTAEASITAVLTGVKVTTS